MSKATYHIRCKIRPEISTSPFYNRLGILTNMITHTAIEKERVLPVEKNPPVVGDCCIESDFALIRYVGFKPADVFQEPKPVVDLSTA